MRSAESRDSSTPTTTEGSDLLLMGLFFVSGFAAVLYQIVWQRMLFAHVGIHVEAVTLVVTVFIAGLGFGSLLGGQASRIHPNQLLKLFALVEFCIGGYGAASPALFGSLQQWTPQMGSFETALATAALVLPPTMAMGATLPILVAHQVQCTPSVGRAVGTLYGVNTLGSAVAAVAAGLIVMRSLGQTGAIALAASCNAAVAVIALLAFRRAAR